MKHYWFLFICTVSGESLTSRNLVDDMMKELNSGMNPVDRLLSGFEIEEGAEIDLDEADIKRIAEVTCLAHGTTLDDVCTAVLAAVEHELEGES